MRDYYLIYNHTGLGIMIWHSDGTSVWGGAWRKPKMLFHSKIGVGNISVNIPEPMMFYEAEFTRIRMERCAVPKTMQVVSREEFALIMAEENRNQKKEDV